MAIHVKICGLRDPQSVQSAIDAQADYVGFVHYAASPRHITFQDAAQLKSLLPASVLSVCVLVDPDDGLIEQASSVLKPAFFQLHGKESPQRVQAIRSRFPDIRLIKAISVRSAQDLAAASAYYDCCDMLMFDAKAPEGAALPGGNGLSFDWTLLKGQKFGLPWMLSGGLTCDNVAHAIDQTGAIIVDVSSGVEQKAGVKDAALIHAFVKAAKHA